MFVIWPNWTNRRSRGHNFFCKKKQCHFILTNRHQYNFFFNFFVQKINSEYVNLIWKREKYWRLDSRPRHQLDWAPESIISVSFFYIILFYSFRVLSFFKINSAIHFLSVICYCCFAVIVILLNHTWKDTPSQWKLKISKRMRTKKEHFQIIFFLISST